MGVKSEESAGYTTVRLIPLSYDQAESHTSALRLILTLRPEWEHSGKIEFIRFTDGITNTLLKVINKLPGLSAEEIDTEAILLRAYGKGTDLIIDRERETQNHELLMQYGLAPALLARFHNGMLYKFIRGAVTSPADLRKQEIWRAVARRLAEWHAVVPCLPPSHTPPFEVVNENGTLEDVTASPASKKDPAIQASIDNVAPGKPAPNVWTVMQKWIYALPAATPAQAQRQSNLQKELTRLVAEFSNRPGLGKNGLVFAHCDLLSGNVIIQPRNTRSVGGSEIVSFIDYEYAAPSPAAFDIANHFAEWGGFDCEHDLLPTKSQRLDFIQEYVKSYFSHLGSEKTVVDQEAEAGRLFDEVDMFRGIPGFYWGIWAIIQAKISQIDFDYASYAEIRLGEYWSWRAETDGSRAASVKEIPVREKRWAQKE
ncbi:kinase-like domain-containing protein [Calycina marina]|uniref:ethanolamine kinase n=1 Tax=Calycina marina TaxID=1763456 RepID=A0A9P7Z9E8_9HELO|nr:kinase-like domain-containing protein [Calycina marina]